MKYIVECFNDQCLLESYGINPAFDINHQYNQGKDVVLEQLSKQKNRVGMIDFDNEIISEYFDKFKHVKKISNEINVYFEEENKNYLIVFNKKIETLFVSETIATNSIDTAKKLGFKNTVGNYHKIASSKEKYNKLKNLLSTIIQRSPNLQTLKEYL